MSIKSFFTSFFDSIADSSGLFNFREELFMAAVQDEFQNDLDGRVRFDGIVLQVNFAHPAEGNVTAGYGVRTIKVRPLELHNFIIPHPCAFSSQSAQQYVISLHPTAYSDGDVKTTQTFAVGDVVECYYDTQGPAHEGMLRGLRFSSTIKSRKPGNYNYDCLKSIESLTTTGTENARRLLGEASQIEGSGYPNEWGLEPQKAVYVGSYIPSGTPVLNGFPVHGRSLLATANASHWEARGGGTGQLLADYFNPNWSEGEPGANFNGLVAQYFQDTGNKLYSNGFRPFVNQLNIRSDHVKQGKCAEMTSKGVSPCPSARPGTSDHGWGGAIDIKTPKNELVGWKSDQYKWMVKNAAKYGFEHPSWAREGGSNPEAWHWEPKNSVIKK